MKEKYFDWVKILAVVGIFLALFLLWERYFKPSFQPCNINATINCDAVISGPLADTLGIPTALIGMTGYVVILFAAIKKNTKLLLGTAVFGLSFCLYLLYMEVVVLKVLCPVCLACQADMLTVFILGLLLNKKKEQTE